MSRTHHSEDPEEQRALKKINPKDKEIFSDAKLAYSIGSMAAIKLKGILTATKVLGQTWLKLPQIAMHTYEIDGSYKDPMEKFHKAYIDHSPDIQVIDLTENDRWLVLATDGLWNHLRRHELAQIVN